jgi:hypothetical protein
MIATLVRVEISPFNISKITLRKRRKSSGSAGASLNAPWAATMVAEFLADHLTDETVAKISYRTLEKGYELAQDHPDCWKDLLLLDMPTATISPERLVKDLAKQKLKVKEQVRILEQTTGFKRRTFFKYRSQAGIKTN